MVTGCGAWWCSGLVAGPGGKVRAGRGAGKSQDRCCPLAGSNPLMLGGQREDPNGARQHQGPPGGPSSPRGSHQRLCPQSESSLPPALPDALQDQQVGLTLASSKLLPLCWDSEHVRCCVRRLRRESLFPADVELFCTQATSESPTGLQNQSSLQDPRARETRVGRDRLPFRSISALTML